MTPAAAESKTMFLSYPVGSYFVEADVFRTNRQMAVWQYELDIACG